MINEIDITRPQDYQTREEEEVLFMAIDNKSKNKTYPLFAVIRLKDGNLISREYRENGYYLTDDKHKFDLVPRAQPQEEKQVVQPEIKKRKIVQISAIAEGRDFYPSVVVLTNNNELFNLVLHSNMNLIEWQRLPKIPQD